jgi:hypothetical protein
MISIKSKQLQQWLGVTQTRSAKAKLLRFGVPIIDGEYISLQQWQAVLESKTNTMKPAAPTSGKDWLSGSSFEDLNKQ